MADEREHSGQTTKVPKKYAWAKLVKLDGDDLEIQYRHTLEELGNTLGTIFRKAQNKSDKNRLWFLGSARYEKRNAQNCSRQFCQNPATLEHLIKMP